MTDLIPTSPTPPAHVLPLENEARLIAAINQVADPELAPYLREAWQCYTNQAYNSAIIWIWCAASCYIRSVVRRVGEDIFQFRLGVTYESLERVNDEQLIETCRAMGILGLSDSTRFGWIDDFRMRRNDLAHGQWQEVATPNTVVDLAEGAVQNFLARSIRDHVLAVDTTTIYDMIRSRSSPVDPQRAEALSGAVTDQDNLLNFCHRLIGLYVSGEAANLENVRLVWRATYQRLDITQRETVIRRAIQDTARPLGLHARFDADRWLVDLMPEEEARKVRSEERFRAMLDIGLWMDVDLPEIHREGYYEIFLRFLQDEVERKQTPEGGSDIPPRYFRRIREHAPERYMTRVNELVAQLL